RLACPADDEMAGIWQDVTPQGLRSPPNMESTCVAVNPRDGAIYAGGGNVTNSMGCPSGTKCPSGGVGVLKSTDCGATWTKVSKTAGIDDGNCFGLTLDPANPEVMYFVNGYGGNPTVWKSTNGGVTFEPLKTDASNVLMYNFVNYISLDRDDSNHIIV